MSWKLRATRRVHVRSAAALSLAVVMVVATVVLGPAPEAEAGPGSWVPPRGYHVSDDGWSLSANPTDNSGDHTAYFGTDTSRGVGLYGLVNPIPIPLAIRSSYTWDDSAESLKMDPNSLVVHSVSWTGPAGMRINGDTSGSIQNPSVLQGLTLSCDASLSTCDGRGAQVTVDWQVDAWPAGCYIQWYPFGLGTVDQECDRSTVRQTDTRTYDWPPPGESLPPLARFTWTPTADDPTTIRFLNLTTDPDGGTPSYLWDFGDGTTSTEASPDHTYEAAQVYEVTLTATDATGKVGTATDRIDLRGLQVNSTGDGGAVDVAGRGCDTGGTVGDQPECTLRAAIQTLNHAKSGTITFAVDGAGLPTIATASPLPQVTAPGAVIDGTTQSGGFVKVTAGGRSEAVLHVAGKGSRVTGLVLDQGRIGVEVAGDDVTVDGTVIGAMPTGTAAGAITLGVQTAARGTVVRDNVIGAVGGVIVAGPSAVVDGNHIGVSRAGGVLEGTTLGTVVLGPNSQVTGNTIRAEIAGVTIATGNPAATATGSGSTVSGNFIGVTSGGAALAGQGEGVRVEGATNVTVSGNRIDHHTTGGAGVSVTGRTQLYADGEGDDADIVFTYYGTGEEIENPITGGSVAVSGNVIGDRARGAAASGARPRNGVLVWADASNVSITGNTIAGQSGAGVELRGGSGHTVNGNTVGSSVGGASVPAGTGILADGVPGLAVGALGNGNRVTATQTAVHASGASTSGSIVGNTLTIVGTDESSGGIVVADGAGGFRVDSNTVSGPTNGIQVESGTPQVRSNVVTEVTSGVVVLSDGATVTGNAVSDASDTAIVVGSEEGGAGASSSPTRVDSNVVADSGTGIAVRSNGSSVSENTVTGTTVVAIGIAGTDATVARNVVGRTTASGADVGNAGLGIVIQKGPAQVTRNVVAATGGSGISVEPTAKAELRGNRILGTTGSPIAAPGGPSTPRIAAAIQNTYEGAVRTVLVVTDLPADSGQVEVFANASCTDAEAEKVLGVTKAKPSGQTTRVILLKDRPDDDAFTVTFTADGSTSELSPCEAIGSYPDSDGDGSPDPLDELWNGGGDPTKAVFVTDEEQLLGLTVAPEGIADGVGGGRLTGAGPVDMPKGRPGNLDMPYGMIGFTIEDLEPGATTVVYLTVLDGDGPRADDGYWKHGPTEVGAAPSWYDFSFDETTGVGAAAVEPVDVAGFGLRRPFGIVLRDGALGDDDGAMNGSIHDPGGIARELAGGPTEPPPSSAPTGPGTPGTGALGGTGGRPGDGAAGPVSPGGALPYTGTDGSWLVTAGVSLLAVGAVAAVAGQLTVRRRRPRRVQRV